jgi:hypothetical protein
MKKIFFAFAFLVTGYASAQVGVGNTDPKATLDVNKASYATGEQAGIAVTQLTGAQVVSMSTSGLKAGTLVYANSTSGVIDSIGFWYYTGSAWSKVGATSAPALAITNPTTDNYTVLDTDAVIYRTLTSPGTLTFPSTLPAGKVFYIANSGSEDWSLSPAPINGGTPLVAANQSLTVVTLGGGQILVTTGY